MAKKEIKHSRHIIGEGYLGMDAAQAELRIYLFPYIKGKSNSVFLLWPPKGYRRKKYRVWIEEVPKK